MGTCYWNHDVKPADTYICLDGTNQVCSRCCVEKCAVETPAWFAKCAEAGHPTWPSVKESKTVAAKLVCFESFATLIRPRFQLAHRFVESERGLAYYTRYPEGLLWQMPESWNTPIYY